MTDPAGNLQYATPAGIKRRGKWAWVAFALLIAAAALAMVYEGIGHDDARKSWTLWQLPAAGDRQMMSYVMRTAQGHLIVVDGGWTDDGPPLAAFIHDHGGTVWAWFITHPHPDHIGALTNILGSPDCPPIRSIFASLPTEDFVRKHEPIYLLDLLKFQSALHAAGKQVHDLSAGDNFMIDGVRVEILGARNPRIHVNALNNSSLVFRITGRKSVLFLGDLGVEGGHKILSGPYGHHLHADYVQMAHHGQRGVDEAFYQAVAPTYCLWPTPRWLWENDIGGGPDSGPFKTMETRRWMRKLGVRKNFVSKDGLAQIRE